MTLSGMAPACAHACTDAFGWHDVFCLSTERRSTTPEMRSAAVSSSHGKSRSNLSARNACPQTRVELAGAEGLVIHGMSKARVVSTPCTSRVNNGAKHALDGHFCRAK